MALITADRVKETTTTTSTGSYSLAGAVTGFRAFSAVLANNDTAYYAVEDGTNWEVGLGTWTTGNNLARTAISASSNSGNAVNWSAGTRNVFLTHPASVIANTALLSANIFTGEQNLADNLLTRPYIKDYAEVVTAPSISSGVLTLDLENGNVFDVALNAAITTFTVSNPPATGRSGSFTLIFTADGTARAVTWGAAVKWAGGTPPTLTSTNGKKDIFVFTTLDAGTNLYAVVAGQNF
jgi:hypothetical protein